MAELTLDTLMDEGGYGDKARLDNQVLLDELERKKRARAMAVPTDDGRVRARLREIGEPITLFGERPADRRDRLIYVLSQIKAARGEDAPEIESESEADSDDSAEEFYTPGSSDLLEARQRIAEFSIPRARSRTSHQRLENKMPLRQILDIRKKVFAEVKTFSILGSQMGDERPVSIVRFSPNSEMLATGSWSGGVKLWNVPACTPIRTLRGHGERVGGIAWHPRATLTQSPDAVNLVSGAGDFKVHLWSLTSDAPLAVLDGHEGRVCRTAFHPSGNYVASASFDTSWRLWDIERQKELLLQEGHSKEVFSVDIQCDGALLASGGLDAIGRVWDLRTGKTAMVLDGHVGGIFAITFSPNGYQIASGSGDDTIKIWDMRSLKSIYNIPAHRSNVSDIRFFTAEELPSFESPTGDIDMIDAQAPDDVKSSAAPSTVPNPNDAAERYRSGLYFASAGYDGLVKIWSADDWQLLRTLTTDSSKVMSVDLSRDGKYLVSGTFSRNFQLFEPSEGVAV